MHLIDVLQNISIRNEFLSKLSNDDKVKFTSLIERLDSITSKRAFYFGKLGKTNKQMFASYSDQAKQVRIAMQEIFSKNI